MEIDVNYRIAPYVGNLSVISGLSVENSNA